MMAMKGIILHRNNNVHNNADNKKNILQLDPRKCNLEILLVVDEALSNLKFTELHLLDLLIDESLAASLGELIQSRHWDRIYIKACNGRVDLLLQHAIHRTQTLTCIRCNQRHKFEDYCTAYMQSLGKELMACSSLKRLQLDVHFDALPKVTAVGLGLSSCKSLQELVLDNSTFVKRDVFGTFLADLPSLHITSLSLQDCGLSDSHLASLVRTLQHKKIPLKCLNISFNYCKAEGSLALAEYLACPNCSLECLQIQHQARLDVNAIAHSLIPNRSLKYLYLSENEWTDHPYLELARQLQHPEVSVSHVYIKSTREYEDDDFYVFIDNEDYKDASLDGAMLVVWKEFCKALQVNDSLVTLELDTKWIQTKRTLIPATPSSASIAMIELLQAMVTFATFNRCHLQTAIRHQDRYQRELWPSIISTSVRAWHTNWSRDPYTQQALQGSNIHMEASMIFHVLRNGPWMYS